MSQFTWRTSRRWASHGIERFTYVEARLPLGLILVPITFRAVADALIYIVRQQGMRILLYYMDDIITINLQHQQNVQNIYELYAEFDIPVAMEKPVGTTTYLRELRWKLLINQKYAGKAA